MISDLKGLVDKVEKARPQNLKRVKYFVGMTKILSLFAVHTNELEYMEGNAADDGAYKALDKLRVSWRNQEMKRIKGNLEAVRYRLQGIEAVDAVLDDRRLEQVRVIHLRFAISHMPFSARCVLFTFSFINT